MAAPSTPIKQASAVQRPLGQNPQLAQQRLPVIPTSYLAPNEQRLIFAAVFGFFELTKIWEILASWLPYDTEPSWASAIAVRGPWTASLWTLVEFGLIFGVSFLRIPRISPTYPQLGQLLILFVIWNLGCWFLAEPSAFVLSLNLFGPPALGHYSLTSPLFAILSKFMPEKKHISGIHTIRLLPYSTATLNPLSLTYCIPPDSSQPIYIPVVFNNSIPDQVSYYIRSLDTGHQVVETVAGASLRRAPSKPVRLQIADEDEDETETDDNPVDPLSALVLQSGQVDLAKLPSVKPADSLALVPQNLESSQSILFLKVDRPSLISLKQVVDKRGDRFHITAHKEAVTVECPSGGRLVETDKHGLHVIKHKDQPAITRCVGEEDVVEFQARGVGALRVAWKKKGRDSTQTGVIEGIENDLEPIDQMALVRRDRASKSHVVPLRVIHDQPGTFTVSLTSVTDSLHNVYTPSDSASSRVFQVWSRPSIRFNCPSPIQLLVDQAEVIKLEIEGTLNTPVDVNVQFTSLEGTTTTEMVRVTRKSQSMPISQAGTYTILDISGVCVGTVVEPSSCKVQLVPPPTVEMSVTTLHECAMDVGVTAQFDFTGSAPFTIDWTEQRKGHRANTHRQTFNTPHGDVVLQPEDEGEYTYTFTSLRDKRYSYIKLDKPPIRQTVHPLASADIVGRVGGRPQTMHACDGDEMVVNVDARGIPPLKLAYLKSWNNKVENVTIPINTGRSKISVPVPQELSSISGASGRVSISLLSIEDGNGCVKKLPSSVFEVDINRQRPTSRFAKSEKVIITEGEVARVPLRLTGDGPWELTYTLNGSNEKTINIRDPNNHLTFQNKGVYALTRVRDGHCSGDVIAADSTFEIDFKSRPSVQLTSNPSIQNIKGVYRHKGFCAGGEDQVALKFDGQSPFELKYKYTQNSHSEKQSLKSAQEKGILRLATEPGHHRYEFTELSDGNYPSTPVSITLEQDVYSRPRATFTKPNSQFLCLDQQLRTDSKIRLRGTPPFTLEFSVRQASSATTSSHEVVIDHSGEWTVELPHVVKDVGRHDIVLTKLKDGSGCDWLIDESDKLSTTIEVVETARIVSVGGKTDLCVGDTLDFILQGKSPWTIKYTWQGTPVTVTSSISRFSRYAETSGVFGVLSVAHKSNQCKRQVTDIERRVHPLPSVVIQEGSDDLREGDEPAVFGVTFTGTPPFTFTYTRSEQHGSKSRVVETQTITDIWEKTYTIVSSSPGDYAITSISDAYCRYPPLSRKMIEN